jgi:hypothetical protein
MHNPENSDPNPNTPGAIRGRAHEALVHAHRAAMTTLTDNAVRESYLRRAVGLASYAETLLRIADAQERSEAAEREFDAADLYSLTRYIEGARHPVGDVADRIEQARLALAKRIAARVLPVAPAAEVEPEE